MLLLLGAPHDLEERLELVYARACERGGARLAATRGRPELAGQAPRHLSELQTVSDDSIEVAVHDVRHGLRPVLLEEGEEGPLAAAPHGADGGEELGEGRGHLARTLR